MNSSCFAIYFQQHSSYVCSDIFCLHSRVFFEEHSRGFFANSELFVFVFNFISKNQKVNVCSSLCVGWKDLYETA